MKNLLRKCSELRISFPCFRLKAIWTQPTSEEGMSLFQSHSGHGYSPREPSSDWISCCYTSKNIPSIVSDEFIDEMISHGVKYAWYFHYMPVGNDAAPELLPSAKQREYMYNRIREIRSTKRFSLWTFRMMENICRGVLLGAGVIFISMQMVIWIRVSLSIIQIRTSEKKYSWRSLFTDVYAVQKKSTI